MDRKRESETLRVVIPTLPFQIDIRRINPLPDESY